MSKAVVSFNAFDLEQTVPGLKIVSNNPYVNPNRTLTTNPIARTNKSVTSSAYDKDKKLDVIVEIGQNTRELMDASLDILKQITQTREGLLIMNYATGNRQWTATKDNITPTDVLGGHGTFDIEFELADPYGYDTGTTTIVQGAQTGATRTDHVVFGGSTETQQPVITITLTKVTSGSNHGITITNPSTGQAIVINQVTGWTNGDVLVIDVANKNVTLNGNQIDSSGPIPEWALGAGLIQYADTFTSRTFSINVTYRKRYI